MKQGAAVSRTVADAWAVRRAATLHHLAMAAADEGDFARVLCDAEASRNHFVRAARLERRAADLVAPMRSLEPSRAILHRSAATLHLWAGDAQTARRLARRGLAGTNVPADVAAELREVLERAEGRKGRRL